MDKLFRVQLVCLALAAVSAIGLGLEVFAFDLRHMALIYVFAALGIIGLVGNAVAAVAKIGQQK